MGMIIIELLGAPRYILQPKQVPYSPHSSPSAANRKSVGFPSKIPNGNSYATVLLILALPFFKESVYFGLQKYSEDSTETFHRPHTPFSPTLTLLHLYGTFVTINEQILIDNMIIS